MSIDNPRLTVGAANQSGSERAPIAIPPDDEMLDNGKLSRPPEVTAAIAERTARLKELQDRYKNPVNPLRALATPPAQPAPAATHGKPDGSARCDCGFSSEVCASNPCYRKQVHLAGLTPGSKWPNTGSPAALHSPKIAAAETSPGDVLAMKESCKRAVTATLLTGEARLACAAIDRLDVKAEAKSQEPEAVAVKPLPSELLLYGLADAIGLSATIRRLGGGTIKHEFDRGGIKQLIDALRLRAEGGGEPVAIKPLCWRDHRPDSFPEPAWSAQTPFGFYNIEEVSASDSPAYVVRLHAHHFIADKDSLDEAKAAAQADYEQRIRSVLIYPTTAAIAALIAGGR